ncbi:MAG: hypothetical protein H6642_17845 [Caldilineaceae bacterium]|nr:hypothetical protein [Caldilineaceae bacterium]MCB9140207.1 hypothetical protein [Caldilineaceae bacterium]
MAEFDARQETIDSIVRRISDLNEQSLNQLSQYISYLKWQEELWQTMLDEEIEPADDERALLWQYDFIEGFPSARKAATRQADMMEIKVASATCGMIRQPAIWEHPPTVGAAVCEYNLSVPSVVTSLRLRFAVGIRDGAMMEGDNLCAFRIFVNGMRVWSVTKQTNEWERHLIDLPNPGGREMVLQFITDGLGDNRWNWAVWGEPQLLGYGPALLQP